MAVKNNKGSADTRVFVALIKKIGIKTHHTRAQEQSGQSSYVFPPNEKHVLCKQNNARDDFSLYILRKTIE